MVVGFCIWPLWNLRCCGNPFHSLSLGLVISSSFLLFCALMNMKFTGWLNEFDINTSRERSLAGFLTEWRKKRIWKHKKKEGSNWCIVLKFTQFAQGRWCLWLSFEENNEFLWIKEASFGASPNGKYDESHSNCLDFVALRLYNTWKCFLHFL